MTPQVGVWNMSEWRLVKNNTSNDLKGYASHHLAECRNERLSKPETEYQLRAGHQQLWCQTLEETSYTLILQHIAHDSESTFRVLKIPVLYSSFDNIQRSRDD